MSRLKIAFPQKEVPIPTKASFKRNPENKLPTDNTLRAKPILLGNS
jgi:hypothetical protein